MRWMQMASVVVMMVLVGVVARAEDKKPGAPAPVTWATTLPAIELSNQPLEKVLNELKQKLPGFEFTIARENVPHDQPVLPAITLENVSLQQFGELLSQLIPNLTVAENFTNGYGSAPSLELMIKGVLTPQVEQPCMSVHVFRLADIIDYRALSKDQNGDHAKQASDDILSLVQAALNETQWADKAKMKLHPPTQALICKVTDEQAGVITQVLQALQPTQAQQRREDEIIAQQSYLHDLREHYVADHPKVKAAERELANLTTLPATQP